MKESTITFETVDAKLRRVNLAHFRPGGKLHFTRRDVAEDPIKVIKKICDAWKIVRPILQFAKPFLPKKWKAVFDAFTKLMDTLCPAGR